MPSCLLVEVEEEGGGVGVEEVVDKEGEVEEFGVGGGSLAKVQELGVVEGRGGAFPPTAASNNSARVLYRRSTAAAFGGEQGQEGPQEVPQEGP